MIDLKQLAKFLLEAKTRGGYGFGKEIKPLRKGFKELEYRKGRFYYRDSYSGFFQAPGQEVVYYNGSPMWAMSYSGGMNPMYQKDAEFAKKVFEFLGKALAKMPISKPFRGPKKLKIDDYLYVNKISGGIRDFSGVEKIYYKGKEVFKQCYIGGLIIGK
jgi:hypothetical protein